MTDVWFRFASTAHNLKSWARLYLTNSIRDGSRHEKEEAIARFRRTESRFALALLLLKLNSKSSETLEWASAQAKGPEDVA